MRCLIVGSLVLALALASPTADLAHRRCDSDFVAGWPNELEDSVLIWTSNEKADLSGPKFRLFSDVDIRFVEPNTEYKLYLRPLDETTKLSRFLIAIEQDQVSNEKVHILDDQCPDAGMLKSLSDESEHLSYSCFRYLVERSDLDLDKLVDIPFEWKSPECGCTEISAEVLDIENKIYTKEDDRFVALTVKSCVRADHVKNDEKAEEAVNEIHDVKVEEAANEDHEAKAVDAEEIYKRIGDYYREDDDLLRDEDNDALDGEELLPVAGALVQDDSIDVKDDAEADNVIDAKGDTEGDDVIDVKDGAKVDVKYKKDRKRKGKKTEEEKKEKKARRKNRRQNRKRRGKKLCCKKGVQEQ